MTGPLQTDRVCVFDMHENRGRHAEQNLRCGRMVSQTVRKLTPQRLGVLTRTSTLLRALDVITTTEERRTFCEDLYVSKSYAETF